MSKIINGEIKLTKEEAERFKDAMIHPDAKSIKKRNAFLDDDSMGTITINPNGNGIITTNDATTYDRVLHKILPTTNPNYLIKETPEQLLEIVEQRPIPIVELKSINHDNLEKYVIGYTIPSTATTMGLYLIYSDIVWLDEKYENDYVWDNAILSVDAKSLRITSIDCVVYVNVFEKVLRSLDGKEEGGRCEI